MTGATRLLGADGELIADIEGLDVIGSVHEPGCPFYALVPAEPGLRLRPGPVLLVTAQGARYPAEIESVTAVAGSPDAAVHISGVLGAWETSNV